MRLDERAARATSDRLEKQFGDTGTRASSALSTRLEAGMRAGGTAVEREAKRSADAIADAYSHSGDVISKGLRDLSGYEARFKAWTSESQKATQAQENVARSVRSTTSAISEASQAAGGLGQMMQGLTSGALSGGGLFQTAGAAQALMGSLSGVGGAGLAAASGVAGVVAAAGLAVKGLYDMGSQWHTISNDIIGQTGKIGGELDAVTRSVANVASETTASLADIGHIAGQVDSGLHLSGGSLEVMTKQIAELNQLRGENTDVRTLSRAYRLFDVNEVGNQAKALNDLNAVSQSANIPINQLLSTLTSAGPAAKQFGLNMGQTAAVLAQFEQSGVDINKILPSLTNALQNISGDRAAGLRDVVTEIQHLIDIGNNPAAADLAHKMFGEGFTEVLQAIKTGTLDLTAFNNTLSTTHSSIDDQINATKDWHTEWHELANTISGVLKPAAEGTFATINALIEGSIDSLKGWGHMWDSLFHGGRVQMPTGPSGAMPPGYQPSNPIMAPFGPPIPGSPGSGGPLDILGPGTAPPPPPAPFVGPNQPGGGTSPGPQTGTFYSDWYEKPDDKKGPRLPSAPVLPYDTTLPAGFANLPQTAELVSAETRFMDTRHTLAEKQARVNQLERDNNATADDIQQAKNDVINAEQALNEAQLRLYDTQNKRLKDRVDQMGDIGAQLDSDFGISKGLAGIAENLTKFIANLAAAPLLGQLDAVSRANPSKGGYGLMGILGAQGAFGPQFTGIDYSQYAASAMGPAALRPGVGPGGYAGDAALLANVRPGVYSQDPSRDLLKGLSDCSSSIGNLVNIMDGQPSTSGGNLTTGNAATWLPQHGFLPGMGGPGDFRVGFNSGHMQATLPGGTPWNWGSDAAAARGGVGGTGAFDPAFTSHYYRPAGGPSITMPSGGTPATVPSYADPNTAGAPGLYSSANTSPGLNNPTVPGGGAGPLPSIIPGSAGQGFLGLPSSGGPAPGPTQLGGGVGLEGTGSGVGLSDGAMALAGVAAGGLDMLAPGAGQAAQTGLKLANRAIQFGGQAVGIGVQGAIDTFLPFGGSKRASNNWFTRIIGGIAGSHPTLPNTAGKSSQPTPEQVAASGQQPGGQAQGGTPQQIGDTNINVTNNRPTEDGTGRDILHYWQNKGPGM